MTPLHDEPQPEQDERAAPAWWPGSVRVIILALGLISFYFTDIFSGGVFRGVVLPIVDVVFIIYLMMLFVGMKYRSKTGDGERSIEIFQASEDRD